MKKNIILIGILLILASCKSEQQIALQSADKNLILKVANEKFEKKKWQDAIALYERLTNLVAGTDDAPNVVFNSAYANYYDKNYKLAGYQFKNFAVSFPQDPRKEEAAYLSALCYYEGSYDYIMKSRYQLATNSIFDLKRDRIESALSYTKQIENELPGTEYSKEALEMRAKLLKEKEDFAKLEKQVEARKEEFAKKQKELQEIENLKTQENSIKGAKKAKSDSAKVNGPKNVKSFEIKS